MRQLWIGLGLVFFLANGLAAQSAWHWGIRGGMMLGGPVPSKSNPDSSSGKLAVGPSAGIFLERSMSERWRIHAGIAYAYKGATYQQLYRNDTLMALEIFPGVVDTVPTFYYADVNGKMALHYLDLPILAEWRATKRMWLQGGLYLGALLGGKDAGDIQIQIGDGQLFPDTSTTFDNIQEIQRLDWGLALGGRYEWEQGPFIEFRAQRSLRGLYRKGFLASQGLDEIALYHTQFYFGLGWMF
ncbi:MAG TPA: outer membrane beta-barrel protein [Bacteroidia bacterium]|nr:outer membrane beta-barrel protein [Bacteroidia bacterium]